MDMSVHGVSSLHELPIQEILENLNQVIQKVNSLPAKKIKGEFLRLSLFFKDLFQERIQLEQSLLRSDGEEQLAEIGRLKEYVEEILKTSEILKEEVKLLTIEKNSLAEQRRRRNTTENLRVAEELNEAEMVAELLQKDKALEEAHKGIEKLLTEVALLKKKNENAKKFSEKAITLKKELEAVRVEAEAKEKKWDENCAALQMKIKNLQETLEKGVEKEECFKCTELRAELEAIREEYECALERGRCEKKLCSPEEINRLVDSFWEEKKTQTLEATNIKDKMLQKTFQELEELKLSREVPEEEKPLDLHYLKSVVLSFFRQPDRQKDVLVVLGSLLGFTEEESEQIGL